MRDAGQAGDVHRFLELDILFHSLLLTGSGNEMFANMVGQVTETLTGRTIHGLMPDHPRETALRWHVDVAEAIAAGDAAAAREASNRIMRETISEMEPAGRTSRGCLSRSSATNPPLAVPGPTAALLTPVPA